MKLRKANSYQQRAADKAARLLADAMVCVIVADCPKLKRKIRSAIASAVGAVRHMGRRVMHSRPVYGVLHVTNTDRRQFTAVEKTAQPSPGLAPGRVITLTRKQS